MRRHNTILGSLIALGLTTNLWALPQDPTTIHGQVQIQNNGANFLQILQTTPQAIVNWNQFNIGLGETVRFLQPSQQAAILNRVTGVDPSLIQGMLQANGRVFLLNPNGILFGPNSVVDVGSFTASTLKMSNEDFLNGTYKLTQDGNLPLAALTNQGQIQVAEGGFVVLVSPLLDNQGMILAQSGHVNLGATTQATFSVDGRGLVQFVVPDGFNPQFTGGGQGGTVLLQPGQMSQLLNQVVSNPTLVEAGSFQSAAQGQTLAHGAEGILLNSGTINTDGGGGTIRLDSSQATILPGSGLLSANSQNGNAGDVRLLSAGKTMALGTISAAANGTGQGGFVEVSGKDLWLLGSVNVGSAQGLGGTILLDPTDITIIDGAGGTFDPNLPTPGNAGAGTVSVTAMQGQSAVNLNATHDVTYNGAGFNLGATALTVVAGNDILFNTTGSIRAATLNLNATRDLVLAGSGSMTVASGNALTLMGGRNVLLSAGNALALSSPTQTTVQAGSGDVRLVSGQGQGTFLSGPRTDLIAGGNVTLTQSDLLQNVSGAVNLAAGQDVTIQGTGAGGMAASLGSLNVTAGQDFVGNASNGNFGITTSGGELKAVATRNLVISSFGSTGLTANPGPLTLRAQDVRVTAGGDLSLQGRAGVTINATNSDVNLSSNSSGLSLGSAVGDVRVDSARDLGLAARNRLTIGSTTSTTLTATRDLTLTSGQGQGTFLDGPDTDVIAGRNATLTQSDLLQNSGGAVNLVGGTDVTVQGTGAGGMAASLSSLNVTAGQDFVGNANNGNFGINSLGDLEVVANRNLTVSSFGSATLASNPGALRLRAQDVSVVAGGATNLQGRAGLTVNATTTDVRLVSNGGALDVGSAQGEVRVDSARNTALVALNRLTVSSSTHSSVRASGELTLASGQGQGTYLDGPLTDLVAGGNATLTQSDLLQNTGGVVNLASGRDVTVQGTGAGGMAASLSSLNVTAGQDFVGNASNGNFGISTSGNLEVVANRNLKVSAFGSATLASNPGTLRLRAQDVSVVGGGATSLQGRAGLTVNATSTDVRLVSSGGALDVGSVLGEVRVDSARDTTLVARNRLTIGSPTHSTVRASGELSLTSGQGQGTYLDGPLTDLVAGGNATLTQSDLLQNSGGAVNLAGARDVTVQGTGGGMAASLSSLNVTAGQDFVGNASNGNFGISTSGNLEVVANRNLTVSAFGSATLASNSGALRLRAQDVSVVGGGATSLQGRAGLTVNATTTDVRLVSSGGALDVGSALGEVRVDSARDTALVARNRLTISSPTHSTVRASGELSLTSGQGQGTYLDGPLTDLVAGGNATLTQSDLLQNSGGAVNLAGGQDVTVQATGGGVVVSLSSLNVTAGQDFVGRASNGNFGISTAGDLEVVANRNLTVSAFGSATLASNPGALRLRAQDVSVVGGGATTLQGRAGVTVNATATDVRLVSNGGALDVSSALGEVRVDSARDAALVARNRLTIGSPTHSSVRAGGEVTLTSGQGQGTFLDGPLTDLVAGGNLTANQSDLLQNSSGRVNMSAGNDLTLQAVNGGLVVSVGGLNLTAGRDLVTQAPNGNLQLTANSSPLGLAAGQNLTVGSSGFTTLSSPGNVSVSATNITAQTGGDFNLNSGSANVTLLASQTLDLNTGGSSRLNAPGGNVTVGGNGALNLDGSTLVVTGAGARILSGTSNAFKPGSSVTTSSAGIDAAASGNFNLSNLTLVSNGSGPVSLQAGANLTVGTLATSSGGTANLTGANIIINSMDRISGGNYTITTPGNLTELNPATNPPVLAALNITAGRAFNTNVNAANSSFSIPDVAPANLTVLVTAGNDSVFNSSASFQNFGGDVQPGHITGQTGDIYVDGVLFYGGEPPAPPPPPTPPPGPPPVPPIPPDPVVEPTVAAAIAAAQRNPLTAEQRSQILAQSNLALGNLGSFSRVLSDSERERLTVRQDSLNQTWALDPFSPTLALTLPGGTPLVYPSELRGLEALLLMSNPGDDPEEKARGAYNVIVDQELREIWEIRYWRHLLEGFVIWEDRE